MAKLNREEKLRLLKEREALQRALALKEREAAQQLALQDFPHFVTDCCGLNVSDAGDGNPWFDFSKDSPYRLMFDFLTNRNGKHKALFAGRRSGKTYLAMSILLWRLVLNHEYRVLIGSENQQTAIDRGDWLRFRLQQLDSIYGPILSRQWAKEKFTLNRQSGLGGNPSVVCGGPRQGKTGGHPDLILLDDLVGEEAFESTAMQREGVTWVTQKLWFQMGTNTEIWVIGTMWPGSDHFYRWVMKTEGKPRLKPVGHGAYMHEGEVFDILSFTSGRKQRKPVFACLPLVFLDRQFKINPVMARCQYDNEQLDNQDVAFNPGMIQFANPPEDGGLTWNVVGDWATSLKIGSSISSWMIVAKDPNDNAYIMYANAGRLHPDVVVESMMDSIARCQVEHKCSVESIPVENTGPGTLYAPKIQTAAMDRKLPLVVSNVPRQTDTHARILAHLYGPMQAKRLFFSPQLPPDFIRMDEHGELGGLAAEEILGYSFSSDKKPDILDAMSDIFAVDKGGQPLLRPPEGSEVTEEPAFKGRAWIEHVAKHLARRRSKIID